jgi:hypothetical protein
MKALLIRTVSLLKFRPPAISMDCNFLKSTNRINDKDISKLDKRD